MNDDYIKFDALQLVVEAAIRQQEVAERQQQLAEQAITSMKQAVEAFENAATKSIHETICQAVDASLVGAAGNAAREMIGNATNVQGAFQAAKAAAEQAQTRYKQVGRFVFLWVFLAGIAVLAVLIVVLLFWVPSLDEIQSRRAEVARLEAIKSKLEPRRGDEAQIVECPESTTGRSRICVRMDDGSRGGAWHFLKGP